MKTQNFISMNAGFYSGYNGHSIPNTVNLTYVIRFVLDRLHIFSLAE